MDNKKILECIQHYVRDKEISTIIPITRKGYWIFQVCVSQAQGIFNQVKIYSDRYLTKLMDGEQFKNKKVLVFDDIIVTGDHLFYYFLLLKKMGAEVNILTLNRCLFSKDKFVADIQKNNYFSEIFRDEIKNCLPIEKEQKFYNLLDEFWKIQKNDMDFVEWLTNEDVAKLSAQEIKLLGQNLCPMIVDLPLMVTRKDIIIDGTHSSNSFFTINKQNWELMKEDLDWQFVENISEETLGVEVNASFFEAAKCMSQLSSWGQVEDCIVKCKYRENEDGIEAIFVPFVIMKSMNYFELIHLYVELFYQNEEKVGIFKKLFNEIGDNFNMYRMLYRSIVLYFSLYLEKEFEIFLKPFIDSQEIIVDENFMKQHLPENQMNLLKSVTNDKENMKEKLFVKFDDEIIFKYNLGRKEIEQDIWQKTYYYVKQKLIDIEFGRNKKEDMLTIEKMENDIEEMIPEMGSIERRIVIAKLITLFQEACCFSNYLINNKEKGIVQRGFRSGKNATNFLGIESLNFIPYIYALYLRVGAADYYKYYDRFIENMRVYFYEKKYFQYKISGYTFEYCKSFFQDDSINGWGIERKISSIRYMLEDYLDGDNNKYDDIFELVYEWEL